MAIVTRKQSRKVVEKSTQTSSLADFNVDLKDILPFDVYTCVNGEYLHFNSFKDLKSQIKSLKSIEPTYQVCKTKKAFEDNIYIPMSGAVSTFREALEYANNLVENEGIPSYYISIRIRVNPRKANQFCIDEVDF